MPYEGIRYMQDTNWITILLVMIELGLVGLFLLRLLVRREKEIAIRVGSDDDVF